MPTAIELFGTEVPPASATVHEIGPVSFELSGGGVHAIRYGGEEVIRAITFPVRDRDWGTITPVLSDVTERREGDRLHLSWQAEWCGEGAVLRAALTLTATPDSLKVHARAEAEGAFETNRAGFTVLHPVAVSGCPVRVEHSDGSLREAHMPTLIEPWQPFMDIRALTHRQAGIVTECRLEGDTFEMEDQRQWSDASFKTYNRPLALPWPYRIDSGTAFEQSISLSFAGPVPETASDSVVAVRIGPATGTLVPDLSLVVTACEARAADPMALEEIAPQRLTLHVEGTEPLDLAAFADFAKQAGLTIDMEYAAACTGDLDAEFTALADAIRAASLPVASLFVCPSVDRQSTPPGSDWPECPPLATIHAAAARAFPDMPRGGGMLSYFTEFNRKPPPVGMLDFTGHGTNPIVHDASDRAVMQSLTALPWILRTGKAIAGGVPYRLGLSSIPMRQNPYGSRTMPNPDGARICMAEADPRHDARFGAAFALGYLAAIAPFGIASWTPAAAAGPRGTVRNGTLTPLGRLLSRLARLAGEPVRAVHVSDPERVAALCAGSVLWLANLTADEIELRLEGGDAVTLAPYATRELAADQS